MITIWAVTSITDHHDKWIKSCIASGKYATDSEYVRDLIRRDESQSEKIEKIRAALIEAEQSRTSDRSVDDIWAEARNQLKIKNA